MDQGKFLVRRISQHDIKAILMLMGMYAIESDGPAISFDRWGPGVSVPFEPLSEAVAMPPEPRDAISSLLHQMVDSPLRTCFVAECNSGLLGFITVYLSKCDDLPGCLGIINELYVRPDSRRQSIGTKLAEDAIEWLRNKEASAYRAEVPVDSQVGKIFWRRMGWENDILIWSMYG